jgi:hypothetical protein
VKDVTITPTDNSPYLVEGSVTLLDAEGNAYEIRDTISLPLRPLEHQAVLRRDPQAVELRCAGPGKSPSSMMARAVARAGVGGRLAHR